MSYLVDVSHSARRFNEGEIGRCIDVIHAMLKRPINRRVIDIQKKYINKYIKPMSYTGGVALDAGVGYGASAGELAKAGLTVHGVDIDPVALKMSTVYVTHMLQKPYLAYFGDLNTLELPEWFYEVVSCTETLEHILEDDKVIKKLYNALRYRGIAIISVPIGSISLGEELVDARRVEFMGKEYDIYGHIREYDVEEFLQKMRDAGFRIVETSIVKGTGGSDPRHYTILAVCATKDES